VEGGYPVAKEWLESYERSAKECAELERLLLGSLNLAPQDILDTPVFRGRFLSESPTSLRDFGPPPPQRLTRGRYNAKGDPALYLCSTKAGVMRELEPTPVGCELWIRRFRLLPELRMADARELPINSFAAAVFWLIEHGRNRRQYPRLGERVGHLVSCDFDGLIVPGVRGDPTELYWNAVVFRLGDRWIRLIDQTEQPELLRR
jgi:RES domain